MISLFTYVSKLHVGMKLSVDGCLSLHVSPVMNWRLVEGGPWDGIQPPCDP